MQVRECNLRMGNKSTKSESSLNKMSLVKEPKTMAGLETRVSSASSDGMHFPSLMDWKETVSNSEIRDERAETVNQVREISKRPSFFDYGLRFCQVNGYARHWR